MSRPSSDTEQRKENHGATHAGMDGAETGNVVVPHIGKDELKPTTDILFGRGSFISMYNKKHNSEFLSLVEAGAMEYHAAAGGEAFPAAKRAAQDIVKRLLKKSEVRFLHWDGDSRMFAELDVDAATMITAEKIKNRFKVNHGSKKRSAAQTNEEIGRREFERGRLDAETSMRLAAYHFPPFPLPPPPPQPIIGVLRDNESSFLAVDNAPDKISVRESDKPPAVEGMHGDEQASEPQGDELKYQPEDGAGLKEQGRPPSTGNQWEEQGQNDGDRLQHESDDDFSLLMLERETDSAEAVAPALIGVVRGLIARVNCLKADILTLKTDVENLKEENAGLYQKQSGTGESSP